MESDVASLHPLLGIRQEVGRSLPRPLLPYRDAGGRRAAPLGRYAKGSESVDHGIPSAEFRRIFRTEREIAMPKSESNYGILLLTLVGLFGLYWGLEAWTSGMLTIRVTGSIRYVVRSGDLLFYPYLAVVTCVSLALVLLPIRQLLRSG